MNVIITGANGFIGNVMCEYMKQQGYDVTGWDVGAGGDEIPVEAVDMTSLSAIEKALEGHNPGIIIHCAGSANVSDSVANPDRDFELNVGITHNLLYAMHRCELHGTRLLFLSSAGVYGNPARLPISESDGVHPVSPYALHKSMCEDMCRYFAENHGFDIRIARIFSAYGPGLRKQIFWDMYRKSSETGKLTMFGDGTESRDFIHIDDLKNALYLIATSDKSTIGSASAPVINVANGEEITIDRVVRIFADHMDIASDNISFNGIKRAGDPHNWQADITNLKALGYEQKVSIEDGIAGYCDWVRDSQE